MQVINKKRAFRNTGVSAPIDTRLSKLLIELPTNEEKGIVYYSTIEALIRAYGVKVNGSHPYDDTAWLNFSVLATEGVYAGREYDYGNESWKYYYSPPSDLHFQFKHYDNLTVKLFDLSNEDVLMIWSLYGRDWLFEFDLQPELHDTFDRPLMTQPSFTGKEWQGGKLQNLHKLVDGNERQPSDKQGQGRVIYSKHIAEYRIIPQSENLDKWVYHEELKPIEIERLAHLDINWKFKQLNPDYNPLSTVKQDGNKYFDSRTVGKLEKQSNRSKRGYADIKTSQKTNRYNHGAFHPVNTTTSRSYKTTDKLPDGSKQFNGYRFTVTGGNLLCLLPDKGQLLPVAKIRMSSYSDDVDRHYLEWLPTSIKLSIEQRENAKRCIREGTKRTTADTVINSNVESYRDNTMLYGVVQAEMRERGDSVVVLPATKTPKQHSNNAHTGTVLNFSSNRDRKRKQEQLTALGIKYTKVNNLSIRID